MVQVTFRRDSRQRLSSIFASGHADAAPHGEDLVCAAVSAILQAARLGLEEHVEASLEVDQRSGNLSLRWPESLRDDPALVAIVATAELAVGRIASQYPGYVRANAETEGAT